MSARIYKKGSMSINEIIFMNRFPFLNASIEIKIELIPKTIEQVKGII